MKRAKKGMIFSGKDGLAPKAGHRIDFVVYLKIVS
jgi:hypothetical protein